MSAFRRYAMVTALEILEASAEAWWRLSSNVGQLFVRLETSIPPADSVISILFQLRAESEKIGLSLSTMQIDRIKDYVRENAGRVSLQEFGERLRQLVVELHTRVLDELGDRFFIVLPNEMAQYYKQPEPLFGASVESAFPKASEDIAEAGKCLAVGRSTATVFHLMRAMESSVVALGSKLNATVIDKDNLELEWGKILRNINGAIEALPRGSEKESWSNASSLLLHAKIAWRNPTMHPKQTYTIEQARQIINCCRAFMNAFSELV